jgi:hypothetical protein
MSDVFLTLSDGFHTFFVGVNKMLNTLRSAWIAKSRPQGRKIAGFATEGSPARAFNVQHHLDQYSFHTFF